ncbi:MAG: serine/threonine protein kinase [Thermoleophilales bacterium]|nr:serine/threonine protein kinase [Thermoleophilales bacterium]
MAPDNPQAQPGPGTVVAGFELDRLLGEGGMGQVWLGRHGREQVAVKLMRGELAKSDQHRRRFGREAAAAQAASSRHVVPIIDTGEWEGVPYLIQSFVSGGSLRDRLERSRRLPLDETQRICAEVGTGLNSLHENGLIHRDVKPENILFDGSGMAMISDFGLVKDPGASMLTMPGKTIGTTWYMAPEQVRGEEVTAATDVYALACVAYECLVGKTPFGDTSGMKTLWAHLRDEPANPCELQPDIPEGVGFTLLKGLEKEPGDRPPTPAMLAVMLRV